MDTDQEPVKKKLHGKRSSEVKVYLNWLYTLPTRVYFPVIPPPFSPAPPITLADACHQNWQRITVFVRERLVSLGVMGEQLSASLKLASGNSLVPSLNWSPMMPRDASPSIHLH